MGKQVFFSTVTQVLKGAVCELSEKTVTGLYVNHAGPAQAQREAGEMRTKLDTGSSEQKKRKDMSCTQWAQNQPKVPSPYFSRGPRNPLTCSQCLLSKQLRYFLEVCKGDPFIANARQGVAPGGTLGPL